MSKDSTIIRCAVEGCCKAGEGNSDGHTLYHFIIIAVLIAIIFFIYKYFEQKNLKLNLFAKYAESLLAEKEGIEKSPELLKDFADKIRLKKL